MNKKESSLIPLLFIILCETPLKLILRNLKMCELTIIFSFCMDLHLIIEIFSVILFETLKTFNRIVESIIEGVASDSAVHVGFRGI